MTDKEIIKAYELCHSGDLCDETNCPFFSKCKTEDLSVYLLDLIKRQQAEIERLKNECFCLAIERDFYKDVLDTAVTEAIKEFAHFLIDRTENGVVSIADLPDLVVEFNKAGDEK